MMIRITATLALCFLLSSCGSIVKRRDLEIRKKAAFDFNCSANDLKVIEIDYLTAGVEGCGKRGTYVFETARGIWVTNAEAKQK